MLYVALFDIWFWDSEVGQGREQNQRLQGSDL